MKAKGILYLAIVIFLTIFVNPLWFILNTDTYMYISKCTYEVIPTHKWIMVISANTIYLVTLFSVYIHYFDKYSYFQKAFKPILILLICIIGSLLLYFLKYPIMVRVLDRASDGTISEVSPSENSALFYLILLAAIATRLLIMINNRFDSYNKLYKILRIGILAALLLTFITNTTYIPC